MASQKTKFTVGLFVACGATLAILVMIWLGMSRFFEKGQYYVTYFDESVQGLDVDSPVKYRGVFIGRVERLGVAPDSRLIKVVLKIESGQTLDSDIVAQLKSVGITGRVFIELDRRKKDQPDKSPTISFPSEYPIIASRPSEIGELLSGINEVLDQIKSLDIKGITTQIKLTLNNINQKVSEADVKRISNQIESSMDRVAVLLDDRRWDDILDSVNQGVRSFDALMNKADGSLDHVDKTIARAEQIVRDNEKKIKAAIDDFKAAMYNANILLKKGSSLLNETDDSISKFMYHLSFVAQNLKKASDSLNRITELLADQPSQLLFGEPPVPRKVETELDKN